jgi:MFS family permease
MQEKLRYELNKFLRTHDALGWFILMIGVSLIGQFILYVLLNVLSDNGTDIFYKVLSYIAMPASVQEGVTRPWTIFTWPFVSLNSFFHFGETEGGVVVRDLAILRYVVSGYIMYVFGRIGQQLLGSERLRRFILLCIPVIGIIIMLMGSFIYTGAENAPAVTYLSGMMPLVVALIAATATLVPNYPVQLFLFGNVAMKWVAVGFIALEFVVSGVMLSPLSWAVLLAAGFGFGFVTLMRQGTDLVEVVSSWFRKKEPIGGAPRPKPEAKVRSMRMKTTSSASSARSNSKDGPVSQEELDRILDKISEQGYESLSREEKERLLRASEEDKS